MLSDGYSRIIKKKKNLAKGKVCDKNEGKNEVVTKS